MHNKTLEDLAFFRIRDKIAGYCVSEEATEKLKKRIPYTDTETIKQLKSLCTEWMTVLQSKTATYIKSWPVIHNFLKILKTEGTTLDQEQIYALKLFCDSAITVSEQINSASKTITIKNLLKNTEEIPITSLKQINTEIERIIDKNGILKDLPIIREIKQKITSIKSEIDSALKKYTSDSSLSTVLAANVPAYRADRQVLAVKANQRQRINGIVHEVSSSGQTMFIEPDEVVRKNNELIQEEYRLNAEIKKIFTELTAKLSPFTEDVKNALNTMIELDQSCASAKWGIENKCICAMECTENNPPALIKARHPLLEEKAVPIDMTFLDEKKVLIITGPNTGGKTVSIKTFALFSMLNQAGFPIPASEGTRLPIFNKIFADIGDEQSIDQSLSTFSAHMKNIAAAVKYADKDSLVLLDELGSGTDPQEGSAIAMAVLDQLIEKKSFVLVTTHHGILKNYGYTNPSCINASVDFDTNTLSPTYRLLMGIPGESHALDIAKRSGLPLHTVNKAKSYIINEQADVSTLIKGLTEKHAELLNIEKQTKIREAKLKEKELKQTQKSIELKEYELQIKEREQLDSSKFLKETRKELENLVRTLREGEITREKTLKVKEFISTLTNQIDQQELTLEEEKETLEKDKLKHKENIEKNSYYTENGILISENNNKHSSNKKNKQKKKLSTKEAFAAAKNTYTEEQINNLSNKNNKKTEELEFKPGAEFQHNLTKAKGTLISQERKNIWTVQLGSIRMSLKEKDMTLINPITNKASYTVELVGNSHGQAKPLFELRLLGMREEEAIKTLEKQLDLCQMNNFKNFSIIHGKGNGILQQAVQDYLSNYPGVKTFEFARPEDGGTGKTYVEMV